MVHYFKLIGLALLLSVGIGSFARAASFDCNKATTEAEIAICGDPELSELDSQIGEAFNELDKYGRYFSEIVDGQKAWISETRQLSSRNFARQRDFLKFISALSGCLKSKVGLDVCEEEFSSGPLEQCMGGVSGLDHTTYLMTRCSSAQKMAYEVIERVESSQREIKLKDNPETLALFKEARLFWLSYRGAQCDYKYSIYRDGSIKSLIRLGCLNSITKQRLNELLLPVFSDVCGENC